MDATAICTRAASGRKYTTTVCPQRRLAVLLSVVGVVPCRTSRDLMIMEPSCLLRAGISHFALFYDDSISCSRVLTHFLFLP